MFVFEFKCARHLFIYFYGTASTTEWSLAATINILTAIISQLTFIIATSYGKSLLERYGPNAHHTSHHPPTLKSIFSVLPAHQTLKRLSEETLWILRYPNVLNHTSKLSKASIQESGVCGRARCHGDGAVGLHAVTRMTNAGSMPTYTFFISPSGCWRRLCLTVSPMCLNIIQR